MRKENADFRTIIKILQAVIMLFMLFSLASCGGEKDAPLPNVKGEDGRVTILLDAGHGFGDVGCTSEYLDGKYEYELTELYVKGLKTRLEARGYTVLLTHDGQSFPASTEITERADKAKVSYSPEKISDNNVFDAYERAVYANVLDTEGEIDFLLSIHVNANADSSECEGFEIDYCAENGASNRSKLVFGDICAALEHAFPERRRKEFADSWDEAFIVTKYTTMPSVLFETGFASTQREAELLLDKGWQAELLDALDAGIAAYFER